jgi:beta-lactamase regulating signal transducer with metallopeptidase domain
MLEATLGLSVLKVTVAAALGLLAVRLAARCAAATRHAVLVMTFVALAAIPIVAAVAPPYFISVEDGMWPNSALIQAEVADLTRPTFSPSSDQQPGPRWSTLLFAAWASGAAVSLLPQIGAFLQSRRLRRGGRPWAAVSAEAARFGGPRHDRVEVLHHGGVAGPLTCGIVRPAILLPEDAQRWPRQDVDRALAHELAHIARADVLVHGLARLVCAAYWFHPLVWMC